MSVIFFMFTLYLRAHTHTHHTFLTHRACLVIKKNTDFFLMIFESFNNAQYNAAEKKTH